MTPQLTPHAYETADANGLWVDTSADAIAWRRRVFAERDREARRKARFDLEATARLWESWSAAAGKWANALREFGALGGQCEYWCGVPNSASAIPLTFALYDREGRPLPCAYRLKDIRQGIAVLRRG